MENVICTVCPKGCNMKVDIKNKSVEGSSCKRGEVYGLAEVVDPVRVITSTVKIENGVWAKVPIKTSEAISKDLNYKVMEEIKKVRVKSPIKCGTVIIENILNTGANIVTTRDM